MNDLKPNNKLVLEWPFDKPIPNVGSEIPAGELGLAIVTATETGRDHNRPFRYVQVEIFQRIEMVSPSPDRQPRETASTAA